MSRQAGPNWTTLVNTSVVNEQFLLRTWLTADRPRQPVKDRACATSAAKRWYGTTCLALCRPLPTEVHLLSR